MQLRNPFIRWGIGLAGGGAIAALALIALEGQLQRIVLLIAVVDAITTPWLLKRVA